MKLTESTIVGGFVFADIAGVLADVLLRRYQLSALATAALQTVIIIISNGIIIVVVVHVVHWNVAIRNAGLGGALVVAIQRPDDFGRVRSLHLAHLIHLLIHQQIAAEENAKKTVKRLTANQKPQQCGLWLAGCTYHLRGWYMRLLAIRTNQCNFLTD